MNVLKLFSSFNLYGGTPMKILEIGRRSKMNIIYYLYEKHTPQEIYALFKKQFVATNRRIVEAYFGKNVLSHVSRLIKENKAFPFEILHTYFSFGEVIGFMYKCLFPKTKWITSFVSPDRPLPFKHFLLKRFYKKLDGVVYITEYVKKEKIKQFPVLANKFNQVIYNGATKRDIESKILNRAPFELLTVGGLVDWKNTILLVRTAKILKARNFKFKLRIIGDGKEHANIKQYISDNNLVDVVELIGYTTNVGGYIDNCDIYLHPSLTEGFGIAVAEAMMFSKPIIVADAGALPELIEDQYNGYIVSPHSENEWADKIVSLHENSNLREEMGKHSLERCTRLFSIDRFVEDHDHFYTQILK